MLASGTCAEVFSNSTLLRENGLDVPEITSLAKKLGERGVEISNSVYTVDGAIKSIVDRYKKSSFKKEDTNGI